MLKILLSLTVGMILVSITMTGQKTLSIDTLLNGVKALKQARLNNQSNQVVQKIEISPEEKMQIEAMTKLRNNMTANQQKSQN